MEVVGESWGCRSTERNGKIKISLNAQWNILEFWSDIVLLRQILRGISIILGFPTLPGRVGKSNIAITPGHTAKLVLLTPPVSRESRFSIEATKDALASGRSILDTQLQGLLWDSRPHGSSFGPPAF